MSPLRIRARTGHPDFLDLPWDQPLEEWDHERLVEVERGISRHVVRFVQYDEAVYALKEMPLAAAHREYGLLRQLARRHMPVVEAVGVVEREALDAILITRHLDYSLPFRTLVKNEGGPDLREKFIEGAVELLARLHLAGFFWGDFSLSNALFRRDAGALSAYLVDAETGELHPTLTDGQRNYDLEIAEENAVGELLDIQAEIERPLSADPEEMATEFVTRYRELWAELARDAVFQPGDRTTIDARLHRLNELGFDVDEFELRRDGEAYRLHIDLALLEPGHHRRRLLELAGLNAQENQARRLIEDFNEFRKALEKKQGTAVPEKTAVGRWLTDAFEPAVTAVPASLRGKREAAEVYHEILEHRWYLSQQAGRDVGLMPAAAAYVRDVLSHAADERTLLAEE
jgi:hypothetical protein